MNDSVASILVDRLGTLGESYGLSRIAGRMLGFFIAYGGTWTLDELQQHLEVSKASASTNARTLERMGLLERTSRSGDRRDFYRLGENPPEKMLQVAQRRLEDLAGAFDATLSQLPPHMEEARERIEGWRMFYQFIVRHMEDQVAQWREKGAEPGRA